ncbi:hypothetical protein Aoki45_21420 [Algoriphagus sp. oki45]|uniref:ATP-binding protein n=1 Tax=Algoriphagus sp. oki45 TaxID=3067294 RepID=UPI0027E9C168|nr:hypothetical protein Aoki45_21420 [Algoriphagus sp. oki45]
MKDLKTREKNAYELYNVYWDSYIKGDLETFASTLDEAFELIGTSESEVAHNKSEGIEFLKAQLQEVVGKLEMRNRQINLVPIETLMLVNEQCGIYVRTGSEWNFYSKIRISTLLRETKGGWKVTQQHGSLPDIRVQEGETLAIQKINRENLELRDAIKRRTIELEQKNRELEIEAALERVRAIAMGMKKPEDLLDVCQVISNQLEEFGIDQIRNIQIAIIDEKSGLYSCYQFFPAYKQTTIEETEYLKNPVEQEMVHQMLASRDGHFMGHMEGEALREFEAHRKEENHFPDPLIENSSELGYCFLSIGEGGLGITRYKAIKEEELNLFKRFHQVFSLAYQRFRDIQKAEAQTREAQIEAALERVRSRSMAMHSSSELADLSMELVKQVQNLGMDNWFCAFNIDDGDPQGSLEWGSNGNMVFQAYRTPREGVFLNYYEAGKRGETLLVNEITEEECPAHYDYLCSLPGVGDQLLQMKSAGIPFPTYQIDHVAYFKYGYLLFITYEPVPESHEIFIRFAKVFEQTYTRFLDLQKAEEQAREAQLELSLERIRAQVTAMRESSDLFDIVVGMRKEFISLGHEADYFWHMSWLPDSYEMSMTSEDGNRIGMVISLPKSVHEEYPDLMRWEKSKKPSYVMALDAKEAWAYLESMNTYGHYELADPNAPTEADIHQLGGLTFILARTSHGEIGFSLAGKITEPPQASIDILVRFAGVFDLAYKRFEDLKKAEARIREEKVKTSLERVRSRSLAMHQSSELQDVIKTVSDQFKELEIDISGGAFIVINKDLEEGFYCWGAGGVGNYIRKVKVPFIDLPIYTTLSDGIKSRNPFFTEFYGVEEKHTFFRHLFNHEPFINTPAQRREYLLSLFSGYSRSCVVSDNTSIFIINHEGRPFSNEENEFLKQMGRVFEQAYTRFVDLEKAELQARLISEERDRLEIALNELKTTQAQLIQQEKLASLGQLTAGIAHEIKNPLNFVNNFSDLSRELIEEAFGELEKVESSDAKEEIIAILEDVRSNLTKVYEHGSRADRIVKSMLQHSRASESKRTPQPFNSLVKEFVNLSYHGMRASKSPINVDISLELDPEIGEVSLISEDFSRVILNLCNNAFDAMREKIQTSSPDFHPLLTASSTLENGKILLSIGDNGPGIPEEIKDKILQPFFTTKKGTEGTGLGLSITHDIIKAHGGDLSFKTEIGKGTEFIIQLPSS